MLMKGKTVLTSSVVMLVGIVMAFVVNGYLERNYEFRGNTFEPFPEAYQFILKENNGQTFRMGDQKGKVVLLFFGYANCPDVCPITLSEFKKIHAALGDQSDQVSFVFITVDPERDSPERIQEYVSAFHPDFIGLSGSRAELRLVWDGYFHDPENESIDEHEDGEEDGYLVAHTGRVYVIDFQGRLRLTFPFGMTASDMIADVTYLLNE